MPLTDEQLRAQLARRVDSGMLSEGERFELLSAARVNRSHTARPSWFGWAASAAAAITLVAVVATTSLVLAPRAAPPSSELPTGSDVAAIATPPATTAAGTSTPETAIGDGWILAPDELAAAARDYRWLRRVVVAHAHVDALALQAENRRGFPMCREGQSCLVAIISDAAAPIDVYARDIPIPNDPGTFAFRVGLNTVEYLGAVHPAGDGFLWDVPQLEGLDQPDASAELFVVEGWLVEMAAMSCPAPEEYILDPTVDMSYYCAGAWITSEPQFTQTTDGGHTSYDVPHGLHVQNGSYGNFAADPEYDEHGAQPREGKYLVQPQGCPTVVMGACPVWKLAARIDAGPAGLPQDAPFPSEIDGEPVLTPEEARAQLLVADPPSAPFLVGGWIGLVAADCAFSENFPETPLLAPCDDGVILFDEPQGRGGNFAEGLRLVMDQSVAIGLGPRDPVVLRVHANDPRAEDCPISYRVRCQRAIVVEEIVWPGAPRSSPTPSSPATPADEAFQVVSAEDLAAAVAGATFAGKVFVSDAQVSTSPLPTLDPRCVGVDCRIGHLVAGTADIPVFIRSASTDPVGPLGAYRILDGALDRIGSVGLNGAGPWDVDALRGAATQQGGVYAVDAWLTQSPDIGACAEQPDGWAEDDPMYWCNASWLTASRVELPTPAQDELETAPEGALQAQSRAYALFAHNDAEGVDGVAPWHSVYLIRNAGCPRGVIGDCPAWEVVANLDTSGAGGTTGCTSSFTTVDKATITSQQLASYTDVIAVATIENVGPSFWDSPTGERPTHWSTESGIFTSVHANVERVVKGETSNAERFVTEGGVVGCDSYEFSESPDLAAGSRYVLFLLNRTYQSPETDAGPFIIEAWPVYSSDKVRDPMTGQEIALDELGSYLLDGTEAPQPVER
jgi:hypothetical protein